MPLDSLLEIMRNALKEQTTKPGLTRTVKEAYSHPLDWVMGVGDEIGDVLKGFGKAAVGVTQALAPDYTPYPTGIDHPTGSGPDGSYTLEERTKLLGNALLFGLPETATKHTAEIAAKEGPPQNTGAGFMRSLEGVGETALMDVLPGNELRNLYRGEVVDPQTGKPRPITARQAGKNIAGVGLKLLPLAGPALKLAGGAEGFFGKDVSGLTPNVPTDMLQKAVSAGEIEAGIAGRMMATQTAAERLGMSEQEAITGGFAEPKGKTGTRVEMTDKGVREYLRRAGAGQTDKLPSEMAAEATTPPPEVPGAETPFIEAGKVAEQRTQATNAEVAASPEVAIATEVAKADPSLLELQQQRELLSIPETRAIVKNVMGKQILADIVSKVEPEDFAIHKHIAEAIEMGALDPGLAMQIAETHGIPLGEASELTAGALKNIAELARGTPSFGGSVMQPFAEAAMQFYAEQVAKAVKAKPGLAGLIDTATGKIDPEVSRAADIVHLIDKSQQLNHGPGAPLSFWNQAARTGSQIWRSFMVSQMKTASRNVGAQGAVSLTDMFEHAVAGTVHAAFNIPEIMQGSRSIGDFYGDLLGDFSAVVHRLTPEGREQLNDTLNAYPLLKMKILGNYEWDANAGVLRNWMAGNKPKAGEAIDAATEIATTMTRMQETEFRLLNFGSRLEGNMRAMGYKGNNLLEQARQEGMKPELLENMRLALADAGDHSLKQTFASDFKSGFAGAILDTYRKIPWLPFVGPTFPRFMVNSWRWQVERSPSALFNIFDPEFRKALNKGLDGGFESAEARRTLAKGMSGLAMIHAAYALQNSPAAGPSYNLINSGRKDKDGKIIYYDSSPYQPFDSYMFAARMMKVLKEGKNVFDEFKPDDIFAAATNMRRLQDVPILNIENSMRNWASNNPETRMKVITEPIGQILAGFFTPLNMVQDFRAAKGAQEASGIRDISGNEMFGPSMKAIPGAEKHLPPLIDPFDGKPIQKMEPMRQQLTGLGERSMTNLAHMADVHNVGRAEIRGEWQTQQANSMVAEEMGKIFMSKLKSGENLGDFLERTTKSLHLSSQLERETLLKTLAEVRDEAAETAQGRAMDEWINKKVKGEKSVYPFAKHEIMKAPLSERPIVQKQFQDSGLY